MFWLTLAILAVIVGVLVVSLDAHGIKSGSISWRPQIGALIRNLGGLAILVVLSVASMKLLPNDLGFLVVPVMMGSIGYFIFGGRGLARFLLVGLIPILSFLILSGLSPEGDSVGSVLGLLIVFMFVILFWIGAGVSFVIQRSLLRSEISDAYASDVRARIARKPGGERRPGAPDQGG